MEKIRKNWVKRTENKTQECQQVLEKILVLKKQDMTRDSDLLILWVMAKISFLFICIAKECTLR